MPHSISAARSIDIESATSSEKQRLARTSSRLVKLAERSRHLIREVREQVRRNKLIRRIAWRLPQLPTRRRHTIITGTGRTGTTFLVKLLTNLGLDTGFEPGTMKIHPDSNAGLELDVKNRYAPYIVKNPWICDQIEEIADSREIVIDYAIVPMRPGSGGRKPAVGVARGKRLARERPWTARRHLAHLRSRSAGGGPDPTALQAHGWTLEDGCFRHPSPLSASHPGPRVPVQAIEADSGRTTLSEFTEAFEKTVDRSLVHAFTADDH